MNGFHAPGAASMAVDCTTCPVRGSACGDCFVAVLLDPSEGFDLATRRAVAALTGAGLIGPVHLALVPVGDERDERGEPGLPRRVNERRAG